MKQWADFKVFRLMKVFNGHWDKNTFVNVLFLCTGGSVSFLLKAKAESGDFKELEVKVSFRKHKCCSVQN